MHIYTNTYVHLCSVRMVEKPGYAPNMKDIYLFIDTYIHTHIDR